MANDHQKMAVFEILRQSEGPLSSPEITDELVRLGYDAVPERTLRRWLVNAVEAGELVRSGQKRGTKYQSAFPESLNYEIRSPEGSYQVSHLGFLNDVPEQKRAGLLTAIRDLWTHTSTALEGNTLSLGDTHFLLQDGLTASGKSMREHEEVLGHARAINMLYTRLQQHAKGEVELVDKDFLFALHREVQTEKVMDIYKPQGAWKLEPNGVYVTDKNDKQVFIEFALPQDVDALMTLWVSMVNELSHEYLSKRNAPQAYALIHAGFSQVHPFWDGNGRLARLVANLLLFKAGHPPLIIAKDKRREYIESLSAYSLKAGQLSLVTGLYPNVAKKQLRAFGEFCSDAYELVFELIESAKK